MDDEVKPDTDTNVSPTEQPNTDPLPAILERLAEIERVLATIKIRLGVN